MSNIDELILKHLEDIGVIYKVILETEKTVLANNKRRYVLSDEYLRLVKRALADSEIQQAPNPLASSLTLAYLYIVEKPHHEWEICQITNVILQFYKEGVDSNAAI